MFLQKLFKTGYTAARQKPVMRAPTFRQFSTGQIKPPTSGFGLAPMMMLGASLAGFAYLGHQVRSMNAN